MSTISRRGSSPKGQTSSTQSSPLKISDHAWRIGAAKAHILGWASYIDSTYRRPRHIKLLGDYLMRVERGELKRLMVFMPPRHGKSETTTVKFPSWYLGRNPYHRVILASHTATLALRFSLRARNDFDQFGKEVFDLNVNPDVSAMYRWDIQSKEGDGRPPGGLIAAGVGGPITGQGAHLAVIDDPIKGPEDAHSKLQRDNVWDWYRFVLRTRLQPGAAVILVLTRWHQDDLAGRLLALAEEDPDADQWEVLELQAEAGEGDPLGREAGEALWPEQYDEEALKAIKASIEPYAWNALFQQRPTPIEGNILKYHWWKFWYPPGQSLPPVELRDAENNVVLSYPVELPRTFDQVAQSWDMAFKDTNDSAFVVGQIWAKKAADRFLLDQVRDKMDFIRTIQALLDLSAKWPGSRAKWVEDKANGPAVISVLKRKVPGLIPVEPHGDKIARLIAASAYVHSGNVFLPHPAIAPWVWAFIDELMKFPKSTYKDQADAFSQAMSEFRDGTGRSSDALSAIGSSIARGANEW